MADDSDMSATRVRVSRLEDAAAIATIYAPFVGEGYASFEEAPPSVEEIAERLESGLRTHPWLTFERDGEPVGYVYASPHRARLGYRWAVDTTVYLAPEARGQGGGRRLYAALLPILVAQGYVVAYAGIALPNPASVGLHEAMGFRPVGVYPGVGFKAGAWHDVGWWGCDLAPRETPPGEPIPFGELDVASLTL